MQNFAGLSWGVEQPFVGNVMVTITYFFEGASLDVDNMPKPILDGLNGLVYSDDSQVTDLLCRKRRHSVESRMPDPPPLLRSSYENSEEFVHVNVENAPSTKVSE